MERIDKIFAALDCCRDTETPACETCPYTDPDIGTCDTLTPLYEDIRAEILDRRPRVLSLTDLAALPAHESVVWLEQLGYPLRPYIIREVDLQTMMLRTAEGVTFALDQLRDCGRFWSSKPSEKQRRGEKWKG